MEAFEAGWNRHDAPAVAGLFAESGDFGRQDGSIAVGREAIQNVLLHDFATSATKESTLTLRLSSMRLLRPDVAVADWEVIARGLRAPDGTAAPPQQQRMTMVMTREPSGWVLASARPGRLRAATAEEAGTALGPGVR
jgi:uncharacterized protein (TIGR02246 family)